MSEESTDPLKRFLTFRARESQNDWATLAPDVPVEVDAKFAAHLVECAIHNLPIQMPAGIQTVFEWFLEREGRGARRLIDIPNPAYEEGRSELLGLLVDILESRHAPTLKAALASVEVDTDFMLTMEEALPTTKGQRILWRLQRAMETLAAAIGHGTSASQIFYRPSVSEMEEALRSVAAEQIRLCARYPTRLHDLAHRQFERVIAEILRGFGWNIDLTQSSHDGGIDIIAVSKDVDGSGLRASFLVECKKNRPDRKVGIAVARQLLHVKTDRAASHAVIVTTSDFTAGTYDYAARRCDLDLKNFEAIAEWCRHFALRPRSVDV